MNLKTRVKKTIKKFSPERKRRLVQARAKRTATLEVRKQRSNYYLMLDKKKMVDLRKQISREIKAPQKTLEAFERRIKANVMSLTRKGWEKYERDYTEKKDSYVSNYTESLVGRLPETSLALAKNNHKLKHYVKTLLEIAYGEASSMVRKSN